MPQTILALAAVLVFSLFALSQHRSEASTEQRAIGSEIEIAATNVARQQLVALSALSFDENIALDPNAELREAGSIYSPSLGFDAGESLTIYDDLDDLHGQQLAVSADYKGVTLSFLVDVAIRYVDPDAPTLTSASPSAAKEVTVTVTESVPPQGERSPVRVSLKQVFTPAWSLTHS